MYFKSFYLYYIDREYISYIYYYVDSRVYYMPNNSYSSKPYLGIATNDKYLYLIPFTSAKENHIELPLVANDHITIYEEIDSGTIKNGKKIYCWDDNGKEICLISLLDFRKIICAPKKAFKPIQLNSKRNKKYISLLTKELNFAKTKRDYILSSIEKIISNRNMHIINSNYCNIEAIEKAALNYFVLSKSTLECFPALQNLDETKMIAMIANVLGKHKQITITPNIHLIKKFDLTIINFNNENKIDEIESMKKCFCIDSNTTHYKND